MYLLPNMSKHIQAMWVSRQNSRIEGLEIKPHSPPLFQWIHAMMPYYATKSKLVKTPLHQNFQINPVHMGVSINGWIPQTDG